MGEVRRPEQRAEEAAERDGDPEPEDPEQQEVERGVEGGAAPSLGLATRYCGRPQLESICAERTTSVASEASPYVSGSR